MMALTEKRKQKVREELNKAYMHFGVIEEWDRNERIGYKMEDIDVEEPETINIAGKEFVGFRLSVAIMTEDEKEIKRNGKKCLKQKVRTVCVFANESETKYVLEKSDCYFYLDDGDSEFENIEYEEVALSVIGEGFHATFS